MSSSIESILKEIPTLKAPGVSGSRIKKCTQLAMDNVSEESAIVSSLYLQCKTIPVTHKLGILYVIDSIVRAFVDDARKQNLSINESASNGTTASGAYKISTYIESLVDDSLVGIDEKQKEKIGKLVEIWERCQTFDKKTLNSIKNKHFKSTTPPGTPPPSISTATTSSVAGVSSNQQNVESDPMALLQTLASMNKQQGTNTAAADGTTTAGGNNNNNSQAPNLNDPNAIFNMLKQMGKTDTAEPSVASRSSDPSGRRERDRSPQRHHQQLQSQQQQFSNSANYRERDNHRSSHTPDFHNNNGNNGNFSPPSQQYNEPNRERNIPGTAHYREKRVSYDNTLPSETIKVYSRTLFVGGVPPYMDEVELSSVLRPFAEVQSVILNSERRHAFVKVYSRAEAEQVISSFNQSGNTQLRCRWGVGFGPRDCCDYQHGVSMIPISRLTDADKRWIVNADWGGTGGAPLTPGVVIDEPDIEIGVGVSSKAISKKMPTNSARNGPRSNRPGEPAENVSRASHNGGHGGHGGGYNSRGGFQNNPNNPLQNLFGNNGQQHQSPPSQYSMPGQALPQQGGGAPNNVNSIMQSLTQMMNQTPNSHQQQPPQHQMGYQQQSAAQQQQQPPQQQQQQPGLTPELQALLSKINQK